jgi:hypothetical protein
MLGMKSGRSGHLTKAIERLRSLELVEMTIPDQPRSKQQRLRITEHGRQRLSE